MNTDRPHFQELIQDIESGLIKRVVAYMLDRISRSIIDPNPVLWADISRELIYYNKI